MEAVKIIVDNHLLGIRFIEVMFYMGLITSSVITLYIAKKLIQGLVKSIIDIIKNENT